MNYFRLLLAPIVLALTLTPASAEKLSLSAISDYLNRLKHAQADFTQVNDDGSVSTGKMYLHRPGRARFEYSPPDENLVMAGGGKVAIFDAKSNQPPEQFPLSRTPLNLILARKVNLGRAKMVVGHTFDETTTSVIAQDPKHPDYGTIEIIFTDNPVALQQWVITDGSGQKTTVKLGELHTSGSLESTLFNIVYEMEERGLD